MRSPVVLAALALALAVPVAGASTPTTLYLHVIDYQDMPINTQVPVESYTGGNGFGLGGTTLRCLDPVTGDVAGTGQGTGGVTSQRFHTAYGYTSPDLVRYDFPNAAGTPRTHPSRGLWGNATIDSGAPMALHWFLLADTGANEYTPTFGVPVAPSISVRAAIRAGDDISVDDRAYDAGPLLFQGEAGPATLLRGEVLPADGAVGEVRAVGQVGDAWLYEFILPLQALASQLDANLGFNIRIDTMLASDTCDEADHALAPGWLQAYSIAGHRPRVEWSVVDPLAPGKAELHLTPEGGVHVVANAASVFGAYDVSNLSVVLTRTRGGSVVDIPLERNAAQGYGACGHACGHVTVISYVAEEIAADAPSGVYDLKVSYDNLQGTAHREMAATLSVEGAKESPGLPVAAPLLALAALAVLVRRRA